MQKMIRVNTTNGCIAWINLDNIITIAKNKKEVMYTIYCCDKIIWETYDNLENLFKKYPDMMSYVFNSQ